MTEKTGFLAPARFGVLALAAMVILAGALAQEKAAPPTTAAPSDGRQYSGMYTFLREGEFVQVTIEAPPQVTGFVSRYGDLDSDKGAFLDHFFKTGKLEGNKLSFTTEVVHGSAFDFSGTISRGEGKKPGDEGYYVITGKLTETTTDENKKTTARSRDVVFKAFPQSVVPEAAPRQ